MCTAMANPEDLNKLTKDQIISLFMRVTNTPENRFPGFLKLKASEALGRVKREVLEGNKIVIETSHGTEQVFTAPIALLEELLSEGWDLTEYEK